MIRVGDIYKDERGGHIVVYDITHQIIWYWATGKNGIEIWGNCCNDAYIKLLTKVEV